MLGQIMENKKNPQNTSYLYIPVKKENTHGSVEGTLRGHLSFFCCLFLLKNGFSA